MRQRRDRVGLAAAPLLTMMLMSVLMTVLITATSFATPAFWLEPKVQDPVPAEDPDPAAPAQEDPAKGVPAVPMQPAKRAVAVQKAVPPKKPAGKRLRAKLQSTLRQRLMPPRRRQQSPRHP